MMSLPPLDMSSLSSTASEIASKRKTAMDNPAVDMTTNKGSEN